jgi:hypothetical protein
VELREGELEGLLAELGEVELCEVALGEVVVPTYPLRTPLCWDAPCANAQSGVQTRKTGIKNPSRGLIIGHIPGVGYSAILE